MKLLFFTLSTGCLLLLTGCGRPSFDPMQYQQEQKSQRIFLQEEVKALEHYSQ